MLACAVAGPSPTPGAPCQPDLPFDLAVVGAGIVGLALRPGGGAARQAGGGDRPRRPGQRRLGAQLRLHHRHRPGSAARCGAGPCAAARSGPRWRPQAADPGRCTAACCSPRAGRSPWPCWRPSCRPRWARAAGCWTPATLGASTSRIWRRPACWRRSGARMSCGSKSREAIPRLAAWLEARHGVTFLRETAALSVETRQVVTTARRGRGRGDRGLPGRRPLQPVPATASPPHGVTRCKLQMLRLADPGFRLTAGADVRPGPGALRRLCRAAAGRRRCARGCRPSSRASSTRRPSDRRAERRRQPGGRRQPPLCADPRSLRPRGRRPADPGRVRGRVRPRPRRPWWNAGPAPTPRRRTARCWSTRRRPACGW